MTFSLRAVLNANLSLGSAEREPEFLSLGSAEREPEFLKSIMCRFGVSYRWLFLSRG